MTVIWNCTIHNDRLPKEALEPGVDFPMRRAVEAAFCEVTGVAPDSISSGWGQSYLPESARCAIEGRAPSALYYECFARAEATLADLGVSAGKDFSGTNERYMDALSSLTEALFHAASSPEEPTPTTTNEEKSDGK